MPKRVGLVFARLSRTVSLKGTQTVYENNRVHGLTKSGKNLFLKNHHNDETKLGRGLRPHLGFNTQSGTL